MHKLGLRWTLKILSTMTVIVRLPTGQKAILRPFSDDPIVVNEVHNWQSYESLAKILEGQVILDIGAHIGIFALRASSILGKSGRMIAFEPEIENYRLLLANRRLNGASNISPLNIAISSSVGRRKLRVYTLGRTGIHSLERSENAQPEEDYSIVDVECETIDSLSRKLNLESIEMIKIDVEGHEVAVLDGGVDVLRRLRPMVVMEVAGSRQHQIVDWFLKHGYEAKKDREFPWIIFAQPRDEIVR